MTPDWYAIYCRAQHERTVRDGLLELGVESYLPLVSVPSKRADRAKALDKPLFPGYVFALCDTGFVAQAGKLRGAVSVLGTPQDGPVRIPAAQIEAVRTLLVSGLPMQTEPFTAYAQGQKVKIAYGPFTGHTGVISRKKKTRLIVAIEALNKAYSVEFDAECLRPA